MGYSAADSTKQKFTQKERDSESGLDYFLARYLSSAQGRFTSVDSDIDADDARDPQRWNRYAYASNNPLARTDPDGQRWFYKLDDKGKLEDVQWVNPNADGSYTSPGEGWKEFVPTANKPYLEVFGPGYVGVYHFGERADGSPYARYFSDGGVTDATMEHVVDFLVFKGVGKVLGAVGGAAAKAWRAYRAAAAIEAATAAESGGLIAKAASTVGNQSVRASSKAAAERAAREWVGEGARNIVDRQTGKVVGQISADGKKIARFTSVGKKQPYINLVNKATGGNLHVRF
jgi:RHS repeat-associated protein